MKVNWNNVESAFGQYSNIVADCKSTDYDTDGGFWDGAGDWLWGEDFDYGSLNNALGKFYSCASSELSAVSILNIATFILRPTYN
jgi:hypothetical protein